MNSPVSPNPEEIVLYVYGRDESSTTLECYTGSSLAGDTFGDKIYSIFYKPFGLPTFTQIYSHQAGPASLIEDLPFISNKYWIYTHNHGSSESGQYYVLIADTLQLVDFQSNTVTATKFRGFGLKTTRLSGNGLLKSSVKTRNKVPKF